jgi:hypothetical protein
MDTTTTSPHLINGVVDNRSFQSYIEVKDLEGVGYVEAQQVEV